ncbi:hypothetical protein CJP74_01405 [Psittacicella melopsittaci]|uniref:Uncharacterized protein n=1 Tax=Psittacicella melopsittaci TaxID=2028576 RepID=A0A3A1Y5Z2_9GAMM|nr:hypothetical protein [Psittacicella melopsittaci]RIY33672.1 hypothetical protein CJP74_01405 [Psittacicella melopsittaci]
MAYLYIVFLIVFVAICYKLYTYNGGVNAQEVERPDPEAKGEYDHLRACLEGKGKVPDAYITCELPVYRDATDVKYFHPNAERLLICLNSGRRYRLAWTEISRIYYLQERNSPFFQIVITSIEGDKFICKNISRSDIKDFEQNVEIFTTAVQSKSSHALPLQRFAFISKNCQYLPARASSYYQDIVQLKEKLAQENRAVPADFLMANSNTSYLDLQYKPHLQP